MFDPSKDACLARKYEAAAERGFFRSIKEFRQHQKSEVAPSAAKSEAAATRKSMEKLGSFFPEVNQPPAPAKVDVAKSPAPAQPASKPLPIPSKPVPTAWNSAAGGSFDLPITIGRAR